MRFTRVLTLLFGLTVLAAAEEGMYPVNDLQKLDLKSAGFALPARTIFNPDSISLTDAVVNIGGCTGSFISPGGLILTNHHCAFSAIQRASSKEHDYLQLGFYASRREAEVPAKGYTVRITESCREVSQSILDAMSAADNFAARSKAKEKKYKELIAEAEKANPGKRAEIAEMFPGKSYMLFLYTYLTDVRLVYAPPLGIGNFGGEEDNWVWPRHTGDFSLMRAYVGPDGKPAEFAAANVPYSPRRFLPLAPQGVREGDLAFILGYPGRTFRHFPARYLQFESSLRMPWIVEWYGYQIESMEMMSRQDRSVAITLSSAIKGLANTCKNYQGKLDGLRRLDLVARRQAEDGELARFIAADTLLQRRYGPLLSDIDACYDESSARFERDKLMDALLGSSTLLSTAYTLYQSGLEMAKPDLERDTAFMERNLTRTKERLPLALGSLYLPKERLFLSQILQKLQSLPAADQPEAIRKLPKGKKLLSTLDHYFAKSRLREGEWALQHFGQPVTELLKSGDPFIALAAGLHPDFVHQREVRRIHSARLERLLADYTDVKQARAGHGFIPDANGTLRLTWGSIRGYSPRDAVYFSPFTTLHGMVEKNTGRDPYQAPAALLALAGQGSQSRYANPDLGDVPVDMLYDMDTTGGNSGSPVLNRYGELVGLNFDRAYEATINDYAWSTDYSRSIGLDVRFILWVLQNISGAQELLQEIGIQQ